MKTTGLTFSEAAKSGRPFRRSYWSDLGVDDWLTVSEYGILLYNEEPALIELAWLDATDWELKEYEVIPEVGSFYTTRSSNIAVVESTNGDSSFTGSVYFKLSTTENSNHICIKLPVSWNGQGVCTTAPEHSLLTKGT